VVLEVTGGETVGQALDAMAPFGRMAFLVWISHDDHGVATGWT
jgi:hypothetical protein